MGSLLTQAIPQTSRWCQSSKYLLFRSQLPLAPMAVAAEGTDDLKPVSFVIIEDGSSRGNPLLVSSDGYSYCHKCKGKKNVVVWRCSGNRFKTRAHKDYFQERCKVTLHQVGEKFYAVPMDHNHPAKKGWLQHLTFQLSLKRGGLHDTIKPGKALLNDLDIGGLMRVTRHKDMTSVDRSLAYFRYSNKKNEANCWKFLVDRDYLRERTSPSFLRKDVWKKCSRHLIFATDKQLALLSEAKTWYVSRNLKVSRQFHQLLTVHVYVHLDVVTLVPVLFVMMSDDTKKDYAAIFKVVAKISHLNPHELCFVIDFDVNCGIAEALRSLFPAAFVCISIFFWWQELKLALGETELQKAQLEGRTVHSILRRLFALPLIPAADIPLAFDNLCAHISLFPPLEQIAENIQHIWMDDPQRPVTSWCAFRTPVTNSNPLEKWHDTLASLMKKRRRRFYVLIPQLYREAQKIPPSCNRASNKRVRKRLASDTANFQGPLESLWSEYLGPVADKKPEEKKESNVKRSVWEKTSDRERFKRKLFIKLSKLLCLSFKFCHT